MNTNSSSNNPLNLFEFLNARILTRNIVNNGQYILSAAFEFTGLQVLLAAAGAIPLQGGSQCQKGRTKENHVYGIYYRVSTCTHERSVYPILNEENSL